MLSVAKTFLKYREEDLERILSDEGILLRINRSIQAEGSFGELKQDMLGLKACATTPGFSTQI